MTPLVIVGAGGFGREVAALIHDINADEARWNLQGFVDDDSALYGGTVQGFPVLGGTAWLREQRDLHYVLAIGDPQVRHRVGKRLAPTRLHPATVCHPSVPIHETTMVASGAVLCRGTSPTVSVRIGPHALLDQHCTVGHDTELGAYTTLHPGVHLSGNVRTGTAVEIGTGAVVLPGRSIGDACIVGAGAVVTRDLPAGCTAVGVPARPIEF